MESEAKEEIKNSLLCLLHSRYLVSIQVEICAVRRRKVYHPGSEINVKIVAVET